MKKFTRSNLRTLLITLLALAVLLFSGQAGLVDLPALLSPDASPEAQQPITSPQAIADYLFAHGQLPPNFITADEAEDLGWDSRINSVSDVAPGCSLGGDYFGNYEGRLPAARGRHWYEADCYYVSGRRGPHRIVYSSDGLVYYTPDHYETFTQLFPSWE